MATYLCALQPELRKSINRAETLKVATRHDAGRPMEETGVLLPIKNPSPDFDAFKNVVLGKEEPERVHFAELGVDHEVMAYIAESLMRLKIPPPTQIAEEQIESLQEGRNVADLTEQTKTYLRGFIDFYHRMGYDYVTVWQLTAPFPVKSRIADDTAPLSRGKRSWVEEKDGIVASWKQFDAFPWERVRLDLTEYYGFLCENLPEGMKVAIGSTLYEMVGEKLMGWEGLFRNLYLNPDLVKAIFDKWGQIVYDGYKEAISYDCVGAIFHADDLGYKKGTMVNPNILRKLVFPWFRKFTSLAHENGKIYLYHCCGNMSQVLEDLIEDIRIDAFHSFQDVIMPVWEFKAEYGKRVAALGGVDVDKLARYDQASLRRYVRRVLDRCMTGGRYALGSGNTVTNYVPPENYLVMLEEGLRWKPKV